MRILLVEDERPLAAAVAEILRQNRYEVDIAHDGEEGADYGVTGLYDIILLDIMLPRKDGLSVLRQLRKEGIQSTILLLTAKAEVEDRITGLDTGADDYLSKPFAMGELLARIRALGRRKGEFVGDILNYGDLELDKNTCELCCRDQRVKLGAKEYQAMELLFTNCRQIITKELFAEKVWGYDSEAEYNQVEVYISFLRKKMAYLECSTTIKTVRGRGYMLEEQTA